MWSCGRSPSLVCVFSGRLCVLGLWVSLVPETGFCLRTSSRLVVSLRLCLCVFVNTAPLSSPSPVLSFRSLVRSRFGSRNRGHGGVFSALGCGVTRVPPPLAVRCALFSVDGRVGCFSCLNEIGRSFCGASPASGPASGPASKRASERASGPATPPTFTADATTQNPKPTGDARGGSLSPPPNTSAENRLVEGMVLHGPAVVE